MSLIPVDEAIARVIADVAPVGVEHVPIGDALGRTLASPLSATRQQPPFPASAMDGYAVRAVDTEDIRTPLSVVGVSAAGHGYKGRLQAGEAVRLSTGAPVPLGSDAVLIKENVEEIDPDTIIATRPAIAGRHIRRPGLDFEKGDVLLDAGCRLGIREIALAAAMNHPSVPVRRRPRVGVLATGDELVRPGEEPREDQIVASNDLGLATFVQWNGGESHDLGIALDVEEAINDAIDSALRIPVDVIVTIGGASVGDHDLVQSALVGKGMDLDFWRIAMRPGKPLMYGRLDATRVLGLPGNPVSSIVCALLFLKPLLAALLGQSQVDYSEAAVLGDDLKENDNRQDYLRATLETNPHGLPKATALSPQDSSGLAILARANCLIIREPHAPPARAGDVCRILRLGQAMPV